MPSLETMCPNNFPLSTSKMEYLGLMEIPYFLLSHLFVEGGVFPKKLAPWQRNGRKREKNPHLDFILS
jgi:hypothetical protein